MSTRPKLLKISPIYGEEEMFMEVTEVNGETDVSKQHWKMTSEEMLRRIKPFCESIISNFKELNVKPDSASIEFGLNISQQGRLFIAKSSGQSSLRVTLNWHLKM